MKDRKICSKCHIEKSLDEFYRQDEGYLGRRANCKACSKKKLIEWKSNHPDYMKKYRDKNRITINKNSTKYRNKNIEKCNLNSRKYYEKNKEKRKKYGREYYIKNKKRLNNYNKEWRKNNREKCNEYIKNRYQNNLELNLIKWMRNSLYRTEKQGHVKNKMNTLMEFGYTPKQLKERIECQFKLGMSWNNRNEWHIDHKKPINKFKSGTSPRIINMLCNLQPLWKIDNLSKGNRF